MANWDYARVLDIMRRVIGRRNQTDSLSSDDELLQYAGEWLRDSMPHEIKTFENLDIYEFDTVADTEDYTFNTDNSFDSSLGDGSDINGNKFVNIGPTVYSDEQLMRWYQDPTQFYDKWGFDTDVTTVQTSQPTDILFYEDRFKLKPRPDGVYRIRIFGYKRNPDETDAGTAAEVTAGDDDSGSDPDNYLGRVIAYGAALDYMYDFGYDAERIQVVENRYRKYKSLVHSRSYNQSRQKTPVPRF